MGHRKEGNIMPIEIIYKAKIGLEGITPLLHHACTGLGDEKSLSNAETDYTDEWRKTTYLNPEGFLVVPKRCLAASIREAARGMKLGKFALPRIVTSGIRIEEFEIEILYPGKKGEKLTIDDIEKNNYLFSCPVVVKTSRVVRVRTAVPIGWYLNFNLNVLNSLLTEKVMKDLFERAGYLCGLLDNRPNSPKKPGEFGQFRLDYFNVI